MLWPIRDHSAGEELDLGLEHVSSRVITTFHVRYLKAAPEGPYPDPCALQVLPVHEENGEPEWELKEIKDVKTLRNKRHFLVEYVGYPLLKDMQWRPESERSYNKRRMRC